jgi:hypothetical protein
MTITAACLFVLYFMELIAERVTEKESKMAAYDWFLLFGALLVGLNEIAMKFL